MKINRFIELVKFDNGLWGPITRLFLDMIMKRFRQPHKIHLGIKILFQTRLLVQSNPIFQFDPRINIQNDS